MIRWQAQQRFWILKPENSGKIADRQNSWTDQNTYIHIPQPFIQIPLLAINLITLWRLKSTQPNWITMVAAAT